MIYRVKLSAYAGLYATLDAHKKLLKERDEELHLAQNSLVKSSGSVVGGACTKDYSSNSCEALRSNS
jgi:hypothetical protein